MKTLDMALKQIADDTLAVVAGSLASGIVASRRDLGDLEISAETSKAKEVWLEVFNLLRTPLNQEDESDSDGEWA